MPPITGTRGRKSRQGRGFSASFQNHENVLTFTQSRLESKAFLTGFARQLGDQQPDRPEVHLAGFTKSTLYQLGAKQLGDHMTSLKTWYRMWREDCPEVKTPATQRFAKCGTCTSLKTKIESCRIHAEQTRLIQELFDHYASVR
jgi:hypothetical protein